MEIPDPTPEHHYLLRLVGDWDIVSECSMGPDQPPSVSTGKQTTRALGSLWTLGEMEFDGNPMKSLMTLGFDPGRGKFVGSFVSSCMAYHWLYEGSLDDSQKVLTLNAAGPSFSGDGSIVQYQDIFEVIDENSYRFSSRYQNPDGTWVDFMSGKHTRAPR